MLAIEAYKPAKYWYGGIIGASIYQPIGIILRIPLIATVGKIGATGIVKHPLATAIHKA